MACAHRPNPCASLSRKSRFVTLPVTIKRRQRLQPRARPTRFRHRRHALPSKRAFLRRTSSRVRQQRIAIRILRRAILWSAADNREPSLHFCVWTIHFAKSCPSPHFFLSRDRARRPRSRSRARSRSAARHFIQPLSTPVRDSARRQIAPTRARRRHLLMVVAQTWPSAMALFSASRAASTASRRRLGLDSPRASRARRSRRPSRPSSRGRSAARARRRRPAPSAGGGGVSGVVGLPFLSRWAAFRDRSRAAGAGRYTSRVWHRPSKRVSETRYVRPRHRAAPGLALWTVASVRGHQLLARS